MHTRSGPPISPNNSSTDPALATSHACTLASVSVASAASLAVSRAASAIR